MASELELWKKKTKAEYTRIIDKLKIDRSAVIKQAYDENRVKLAKRISRNSSVVQLKKIMPIDNSKYVRTCNIGRITYQSSPGNFQESPLKRLPHEDALPAMFSWITANKNICVDDELELRNIPYVDDGEQDDSFLQEYIMNYDGLKSGDNKMDDSVLVQLIESLAKMYNDLTRQEDIPTNSSSRALYNSIQLPNVILEAILSFFDMDTGTEGVAELRKRYMTAKRQPATPIIPNMDSDDALSVTRDQALHTHRSLFCRRCYKYDCSLHPFKVPASTFKHKKPDVRPPEAPCSSHCYLREDRDKPGRGYASQAKKYKQISQESEWTNPEQTLFRMFRPIWPQHYCNIAQAIGTKTCREVRSYADKEATLSPGFLEPNHSPPRNPMTKKKQQQRQLWHMHQKRKDMIQALTGEDTANVAFNYTPCDHPGQGCDELCPCMINSTFCEKYCLCSSSCKNRFTGCHCKASCSTKQCPCFMAVRECDPDLCTNCGASDFSTPNNKESAVCKNVAIQRSMHRHLLQAPSDVAGWGIFLKKSAEKNEFVSEYIGELISQDEAERRGKLYDKHKCSFLFNLNSDYVVDATRKGNKIRFANHSVNPNCYAKVIMVNGDHRIGIFAKRRIEAGDELYFDYRYGPTERLKFVNKERDVNKDAAL